MLICVLVATAVATSRLYQGMHYLSDVVAGAALGLVTVIVTTRVIVRSTRAPSPLGRRGSMGALAPDATEVPA